MSPLTSIIVPAYQAAATLRDAVDSALAQTVPVEVIVVDDGSTDTTWQVAQSYGAAIQRLSLPHGGPSKARNAGLEAATCAFVMFLDADDVIAPTKVAEQLAEFQATPWADWVLCDVLITDEAKRRTETASDRYNYAARDLSGWIDRMLAESNFIPIMSPLVRTALLQREHIRFQDTHDGEPEDYRFWQRVAAVGRVRYVSKLLATYRKRLNSRSRLPKVARAVEPNIEQPLRLNLGCGTQGTRSWHPIAGFVNLDKSMGWRFEDGLGAFTDGSVAGLTVSHSIMYVAVEDWPRVFAEFARVLKPGGIIRITEDDATNTDSRRYGGWKGSEPAVTLTSPALVREHLERAGFTAIDVHPDETHYVNQSLVQHQHGEPPDVFFMEGIRNRTVLLAPHHDDETLFAGFLTLRYRPQQVVICYPSVRDYGETATRLAETREAMSVLGGGDVEQWQGGTVAALVEEMRALDQRLLPARVLAPSKDSSHLEHVNVALAARQVFGDRVVAYHTYDAQGKVRRGHPVPFDPAWVGQKLRALARYESQIHHARAHQFFVEDLREYTEAPLS